MAVIGDFNDYMNQTKKRDGTFWFSRAAKFKANVDACDLMDLGCHGRLFTYVSKVHGAISTLVRLDRAMCNPQWRICFLEASVHHLPGTHFDHNRCFLSSMGILPQ